MSSGDVAGAAVAGAYSGGHKTEPSRRARDARARGPLGGGAASRGGASVCERGVGLRGLVPQRLRGSDSERDGGGGAGVEGGGGGGGARGAAHARARPGARGDGTHLPGVHARAPGASGAGQLVSKTLHASVAVMRTPMRTRVCLGGGRGEDDYCGKSF